VFTGGRDEEALSRGIFQTYQNENLRYSQVAPLTMFSEKNTGTNLPAQIDLVAAPGDYLQVPVHRQGRRQRQQELPLPDDQGRAHPRGAQGLPGGEDEDPGHGRVSALPPGLRDRWHQRRDGDEGGETGQHRLVRRPAHRGSPAGRAFRDLEMEQELLEASRHVGLGAQFGGKYFCHDVRVIRLPRHGASCPIGMAVSCSADRNVLGKITRDGVFSKAWSWIPPGSCPRRRRRWTTPCPST
jgi:fumarate hydratase class I